VILAVVLFMALPLAILISVDHLEQKQKSRAEVRAEIRKSEKVRKELEQEILKLKEK
jgi:hypothetical protein